MKDNTVKLSGHIKDRFLERFFAEVPELDGAVRQRLVVKSQSAFTSLRVRKALLSRPRPEAKPRPEPARAVAPEAPRPKAPVPAPPTPAAPAEAAFDPYVFGLVPVFQREGGDGLLAKLDGIASIDQLRQMAKAQQIVLPQELRAGEATAQAIREGIVAGVAKRIKDRRAAAG